MRFINYLLFSFTLVCVSCSQFSSSDLLGHWTAVSVLQKDEPLEINHSEVTLSFTQNSTYYFTSTLNYKEAGKYQLDGQNLLTTDTLQNPPTSKTVLVEKLSSDTLRIKMKNQTDWMLLTMIKK
jgi:hypothetical protein